MTQDSECSFWVNELKFQNNDWDFEWCVESCTGRQIHRWKSADVEPWDLTDDESDNSGNEQDADELVLTEAQILRLTSWRVKFFVY